MSDLSPTINWPGGHRSAISILVHVPGASFDEETVDQENSLGIDYAPIGVRHLLRAFADVDVQATFAFTADALADAPDLLDVVRDAGHEIAASYCSTTAEVGDVVEHIASETGEVVPGLVARLPGFTTVDFDGDWGGDSGTSWLIDGRAGDLPRLQRDPNTAIIPVSPFLLDTAWLNPLRPLPPSSLLEAWMLALDAHRELGSFMPIVVHPHIIGRPGLLGTLVRFLDDVVARGDVWIAPVHHIAATWHTYYGNTEEKS